MNDRRLWLLATVLCCMVKSPVPAAESALGPAYHIVLRSRHAQAVPQRTRDAQTGGGSILVEQIEPNTIVISLFGSAAAGSGCRGCQSGIDFQLQQELEIQPTRKGVRPPRVGMTARVMGTLQVTDPGHCGKSSGAAGQGPACADLSCEGVRILTVGVNPSAVACGQELAINHRAGPVEAVASPGIYCLTASFHIQADQGRSIFHRQFAIADFDPAPQLDSFWADALTPFQAIPRGDFGFKVALRVIEDTDVELTRHQATFGMLPPPVVAHAAGIPAPPVTLRP